MPKNKKNDLYSANVFFNCKFLTKIKKKISFQAVHLHKIKKMDFNSLKSQVVALLKNNATKDEKLKNICQLLQTEVSYYNWVGFYFRNGAKEELILGPYVGAHTDHTVIPYGKGICGQVAVSNENFVVPDVSAQDNYLACSLTVKSEIVVPLFVNGENIGQIDIDSHEINPFTEEDERFLEFVNEQVAQLY